MYYNDLLGEKISALGFGTMRLPVLKDGKSVDVEKTRAMISRAIEAGVNYFDTAVPYHSGRSELIVGEILGAYPRSSYFLADKYPGHQTMDSYYPADIFENQLEKCRTDHFDFYLMHNICESSWDVYMDEKWGILDYFLEQKRLGRIKHLGFSTHAEPETLRAILDSPYGPHMEFCQIQLNYLDWTLQKAAEKVAMLNERGIPIVVMEPLRGGRLASQGEASANMAFRWVQEVPGVAVTLSGMSAPEQVEDNLRTFAERKALTAGERAILDKAAAGLHKTIPCTACRYCCDGCPAGLDIPMLIQAYNDLSLQFSLTPVMRIEALPEDRRPSACLGCGACAHICPQKIAIPEIMSKLSALYDESPKWSEICRQRAKDAQMLK